MPMVRKINCSAGAARPGGTKGESSNEDSQQARCSTVPGAALSKTLRIPSYEEIMDALATGLILAHAEHAG